MSSCFGLGLYRACACFALFRRHLQRLHIDNNLLADDGARHLGRELRCAHAPAVPHFRTALEHTHDGKTLTRVRSKLAVTRSQRRRIEDAARLLLSVLEKTPTKELIHQKRKNTKKKTHHFLLTVFRLRNPPIDAIMP